jgi:outer membrane protein assembly factor BamB
VLGDNLVWAGAEPDLGSQPGAVLIVDAATGALAWTVQGKMPSISSGQTSWFGVFGSALVGGTSGAVSSDGTYGTVLFGLDAQGSTAFHVTIANTGDTVNDMRVVYLVYALSGQTLLVLLLSGVASHAAMSAIDLASGQVRWSHPVTDLTPTSQSGTADGRRGYLIDAGTVYGFDLSTGKQLWRTACAGRRLLVAGSALLVSNDSESGLLGSSSIVCLDCATGRTLWTTAGDYLVGATATLAYVAFEAISLSAIELATGKTRWTYRGGYAPVPTGRALNMPDGPYVSEQVVIVGGETFAGTGSGASASPFAGDYGFLVLDAATGTPRWFHSGIFTADDYLDWPAAVSGSMVYVATTATLYAFDAASGRGSSK